ncbi:MAG: TauD/TfdA dioxygenase family protein [Woeseiaceae bacterium]
MRVEATTPTIGADVFDVELSGKLDSTVLDAIYEALTEHLVLFFRDQSLSPEDQFEFAQAFGTPAEPHPVYPHLPDFDRVVLLENDGDRPPDTDDWHTDLTYQPSTPFLSVLYADTVPPTGGDTLWANMYAAFDALPTAMQTLVSDLDAVHDMGAFRDNYLKNNNDVEAMNAAMSSVGSAVHPIAPKHPVTGKRLLFVNRSFTQHIVGMLKAESDRTLEYLFAHLESPNFQVRFRWRDGSVAMWDNRCTQHFAVADYLPAYRRMHRVIIDVDRRV